VKGMLRHLQFGRHGFFFSEIRKAVEVLLQKERGPREAKKFPKLKQLPRIYYFHPLHIHSHSSPESHIHTLTCLRRRITHNRNVNMIIVYGGRVHKSHHNFA